MNCSTFECFYKSQSVIDLIPWILLHFEQSLQPTTSIQGEQVPPLRHWNILEMDQNSKINFFFIFLSARSHDCAQRWTQGVKGYKTKPSLGKNFKKLLKKCDKTQKGWPLPYLYFAASRKDPPVKIFLENIPSLDFQLVCINDCAWRFGWPVIFFKFSRSAVSFLQLYFNTRCMKMAFKFTVSFI